MCFPARKNITRLPNVELAVGQIGDFINTSISHVVIWLARDAQRGAKGLRAFAQSRLSVGLGRVNAYAQQTTVLPPCSQYDELSVTNYQGLLRWLISNC